MRTKIQTELDQNIDKEVVSTREQSGMTLSYLETWYVIDRLNQVLGQGNWAYQIGTLTKVFEGTVKQGYGTKEADVFAVSYTATVYLNASIEGKPVTFSEVGFGDSTDKKNPGKAHEMATKGAVSDGLKRAAKNLGRSMGLALYDKTQEYVGAVQRSSEPTPVVNTVVKDPEIKEAQSIPTNIKTPKELSTKEKIQRDFKILELQKAVSAEAFKMNYLGNKGLSTVAPSDLINVYEKMRKDFPQLSGGN